MDSRKTKEVERAITCIVPKVIGVRKELANAEELQLVKISITVRGCTLQDFDKFTNITIVYMYIPSEHVLHKTYDIGFTLVSKYYN